MFFALVFPVRTTLLAAARHLLVSSLADPSAFVPLASRLHRARPARGESSLRVNCAINVPTAMLATGPAAMNLASRTGRADPPFGSMPAWPVENVDQFQFHESFL